MTTTAAIYGHLTVEDARKVLEQAGWFTDRRRCSCDRPGADRRFCWACWAG